MHSYPDAEQPHSVSLKTNTDIDPQLSHLLEISLLKTWYHLFLNNLTNQAPICLEAGKTHNVGVISDDHCLYMLVCIWDPLVPTRDSKMADGVKMLTKPDDLSLNPWNPCGGRGLVPTICFLTSTHVLPDITQRVTLILSEVQKPNMRM